MLCRYPVYLKEDIVGYLTTTEVGLYMYYTGNFQILNEEIYRLHACTPGFRINLGVCKPEQGIWHINGKIAKKKIDWENARFLINHTDESESFIRLDNDKTFPHLDKLDHCRFQAIEDTHGISIL